MNRRVLLAIEDDDAEYYVVKAAVEETGIPVEICRAVDGEQAMFFLERSNGFEAAPRPGLILLDMNLPKKDGLEVLKEIHERDSFRSIPIVMFTCSSLAADRQRALTLGANDFITKPFTLAALIDVLRAICSRFLVVS